MYCSSGGARNGSDSVVGVEAGYFLSKCFSIFRITWISIMQAMMLTLCFSHFSHPLMSILNTLFNCSGQVQPDTFLKEFSYSMGD
jgi:hypothetical protein